MKLPGIYHVYFVHILFRPNFLFRPVVVQRRRRLHSCGQF